MKRFLSLALCVCLIFALLPLNLVIAEMSEEEIIELFEGEDIEFIEHPGVETDTDTFFYEEGELDDIDDLLDDFEGLGDEHGIYDEPEEDDTNEIEDEINKIEDEEEYEVEILIDFTEENLEQLSHEYVMDEIIIKFVDESTVEPRDFRRYQREKARFDKVNYIEGLDVYVIKVSEMRRDPNAVLNRFKNNRFIEYAEPNFVASVESLIPNDPQYNVQQAATMNRISAPTGWDIITGNPNAPIAIIDSGIANHNDLPFSVSSFSAVSELSPNNDTARHGTGVAGIAGAIGDNNIGGAGINWNASIINVKVDTATGFVNASNIAKGIIWAADNGARVMNISIGFSFDNITLRNAIDYAYDRGVVIIAASGNDGADNIVFPARYPNVLGVGATTDGKSRVSWSSYGEGLDVVANGTVYTTSPSGGNNFSNGTGTSFAAPQVAGLASLILGINPNLRNDEVYDLIRQGAKPLGGGFNMNTGYGIIDVANTLELAGGEPAKREPEADMVIEMPESVKSFVSAVPAGTRNDITRSLGYEFEPLSDMLVTHVGRPVSGSMNSTHKIYIWEVSTQKLLATADVRPNSALENGFRVAELGTAVTLKAGEKYRIVSSETNGGDLWFNVDQQGALTVSSNHARITTSVSTATDANGTYPGSARNAGENKGFVGVTFFYQLINQSEPAVPEGVSSFVSAVPVGTRNDITRSLGYEFEPLSDMLVTRVGRPVSGSMNSTHKIYIWEVSTQKLLATADVRPNSALENGFRVAELGTAVTLKAGEKYRIVSSETNGGDLWFNVDQQGALTVSSNHARITTSVSTATDANGTYPGSARNAGENKGFVGVTFFYQLINQSEPAVPEGVSSFVSAVPVGTRNDITRSLGYEFEPLSDMLVTRVGRPVSGSMNSTHKIYIWEVSTQKLLATADVRPNSALENGFRVAELGTAVTLKAGEKYRIVSSETNGGDLWFNADQQGSFTVSNDARIITAVSTATDANGTYPGSARNAGENKGFVGVTFFYQLINGIELSVSPVITLLGANEVKINVGEAFVEIGYRAEDRNGKNITDRVVVTSTLNAMQSGVYTITYEVTDDKGNSARSTRLVFVEEFPRTPEKAPIITLIGSSVIVLHETSGTPYTEQMARAIDFDGTDISDKVTVSWDKPLVKRTEQEIIKDAQGEVLIIYEAGKYVAGRYLVTYSVTGSAGLTSTITREVRILTPNESVIRRMEYGFTGKGKEGDTVSHTNIIAKSDGFLDLDLTSLGSGTIVTVSIIDSANGTVVSDRFSALGTRQYPISAGIYEVRVTFTQASGNKDYALTVRMPVAPDDIKSFYFEPEIPLPAWSECEECAEGNECEECEEKDWDLPDPDIPRFGPPSWYSSLTENLIAKPSTQRVIVNGKAMTLNVYLIGEVPFFKLRDFAYMLKGSVNEFNIEWRKQDDAIILTRGKAYVSVGGEMGSIGAGDKVPRLTESTIFLDGVNIRTAAYVIAGNNYLMYSELARIFRFEIILNPESQSGSPVIEIPVISYFQIEKLSRRMKKFTIKSISRL